MTDRRLALITGSSRGLGAATARRLAESGDDVVVTYRTDADAAHRVADVARASGVDAWTRQLDLEDPAAIAAVFDFVGSEIGRLDVLVMNAAATAFRPLLDTERRHVERTFAISVTGFLDSVKHAVPLMRERGKGRIVAVSGADTTTWIPAHGLLGAAKAAMETLVRYLGAEVAADGVTVIGVRPGWMDGESLQKMLGPLYDVAMDTERRTHPMRTTATPDDVAAVIELLCSDAAQLMNGTTVDADGDGVFAFCGRYAMVGAQLAAETGGPTDTSGAPSVPDA